MKKGWKYSDTSSYRSDSSDSKKVLLALVAGIAAGAVLGILFAPEKGEETRKKLAEGSQDLTDNLKGKFRDLKENVADKYQTVKQTAGDLYEQGKAKASDVVNALKSEPGFAAGVSDASSNNGDNI